MWERIENVFHLGIKELRGVRADVVLVFLIVYSFTYSVYEPARNSAGELANASVAIVDEDHSEASRRIRDAMRRPFALPADPPLCTQAVGDVLLASASALRQVLIMDGGFALEHGSSPPGSA